MAIITQQKVKGRNNTLGFLGGLATIGGALTGNPLLLGLGTAMGTANSMVNGDYSGGGGASGQSSRGVDTLTGLMGKMFGINMNMINPASGSMVNGNDANILKKIRANMDEYNNLNNLGLNKTQHFNSGGMY